MGRRSRRHEAAPAPRPARTRSEQRDAAARAELDPLEEGQRPRAVTVAAVLAAVLAAGNVVAYAAGVEVNGEKQPALPVLALSGLLLATAYGMWRARYWAVLGMQALLGVTLMSVGLFVVLKANWTQSLVFVTLVLLPGGALFWFLVKAMARIQMPERRR